MSEFFIIDLRPEWLRNPYVTLWRPDAAGYAYPLAWAGKYSRERVDEGGGYYTAKGTRYWQRFAVPCDVVEAMAEPARPGSMDNWQGNRCIPNTGKHRMALRKARHVPTLSPYGQSTSREGERT